MEGVVVEKVCRVEESRASGLGDGGRVVGFFTKTENTGGRPFGRCWAPRISLLM